MLRGTWDEHWMDCQALKKVHYYDIVGLFPPIPDDVPLGAVPYEHDADPEVVLPDDPGSFHDQ